MKSIFSNIYMVAWGALWWLLIHSAGKPTELFTYVLILSITLFFLLTHKFSPASLRIIIIAIICGLVTDGLLLHLDVISYNSVLSLSLIPPIWILCLWILLGIGIHTYPQIFHKHALLTMGICLLSAPLCYWVGHQAQAIVIRDHMALTLFIVSCIYGISGLTLFRCAQIGNQHV